MTKFASESALALVIAASAAWPQVAAAQATAATPAPATTQNGAAAGQPSPGTATTATAASADDTRQGASSGADSGQVADIVVTAQKRTEPAQRVPGAVTAIGGDQISALGVTNVSALTSLVPSVRFEAIRSQVRVTVRGVGQANTGPNADPAVATNLNGIYQLSDMTGAAFFDLDRVEVLPGPQGTLYGRNAAGGAINVFSRRPGKELAGNASVEYGNYNSVNLEGGIDLPLGDAVGVRAAGNYQRRDGYLSNGADDRNAYGGRVTFVVNPHDALSLVVVGSYNHAGGIGNEAINIPGPNRDDPYYYPFTAAGRYNRDNSYAISAELNIPLTDSIAFTYLGGYDHFSRHQFLDLDASITPPSTQTQDIQQTGTFWSHEARLSGDISRLKWIIGGYYYHSDQFYNNIVTIPAVQILNQGPANVHARGEAAFGQLTYSLTNHLRLTGGLRYSHDDKNGDGNFTTVLLTRGGLKVPSPFAGSQTTNRVDWKAGLEADLAADSLAYATAQTGFNQGGFSFAPASIGGGNAFLPMTLRAYTVGVKNRFANRTIQLNVEGYYYDYNNYQISARDLTSGLNAIYNAQKATIYGAQVDATIRITPGDTFATGVGYNHAVANTLVLPASVSGRRDYSGFELPVAPQVTISASYEHRFALGGGASLTPRINNYFRSSFFGSYNHFVGSQQPAADTTDFQLTFAPAGERFSLQGFVRNMFNTITYSSIVSASGPGPATGFIDPPRTYGVRASARF